MYNLYLPRMNKSFVVTARIDAQLSADLDELAERRDRSRAWLIQKAIASFVAGELDLHRSLADVEAEIERGDYLAHDEFMRALKAEFAERRVA